MATRMAVTAALMLAAIGAYAQQDPPQWNSTTSYIGGGLVRGQDGNFYRALKTAAGHNPVLDNHTYWELYYLRASINLRVATSGERFTSLKQAWSFINAANFASTPTVEIDIVTPTSSYLENIVTPLVLNHVSGSQITIHGDNASKIRFVAPANSDCFRVTNGHTFGGFTGITLDGTTITLNNASGIAATLGSNVLNVQASFLNFGQGVSASDKSMINCASCDFSNCRFGAQAVQHSHCVAYACTAEDCATGFFAYFGATVDASNSVATSCQTGFGANEAATMFAIAGKADKCGYGFGASNCSIIETGGSTATNSTIGYYVIVGSHVGTTFNTVGGNTSDYNVPVNQVASDGSYISHTG